MAGLWDWAKRAYAAPGARALCLDLQDRRGQSVCLLLWAAWAGPVEPDVLDRAATLARDWERQVIGPLRAARRGVRSVEGLTPAACARLRERIRAEELAAERALLKLLQALTRRPGAEAAAEAMWAASVAWGHAAPEEEVRALAAIFPPRKALKRQRQGLWPI